MTLLTLNNLRCELGGKLLFEVDHLTIEEGDIIGLIGKNGSGKSSLLRMLAGQLNDYSGDVLGNPLIHYSDSSLMENMAKSGGEASISTFLKSLREPASLYLLDEPTTYLDQNNFNKVVRMIERSTSAFCIASHDRAFLDAVATKIWLIDQGKVKEYSGSFSDYEQERAVQLLQYENDLMHYLKEKKRIKSSLQAMKEKRDRKKGKPKKMSASEYRIAGVKTKMAVKQKKLQRDIGQQENKLGQLKRPERIEDIYDVSFLTQFGSLPKRQIVIPSHKAMIGNKVLWSIPAITLKSGDKLGITGANGTGKTTFLNYVVSVLPSTYKVCYFQQNRFQFSNPKMTVYETIVEAGNGRLSDSQVRILLALLDFKNDKVFRIVGQLSQGEQVKISLLSLLVEASDILILDEITSFLDLKTIEAVEKVLAPYFGILIFVSHDQYFVNHLANVILDIDDFKEA